MSNVGQRERVTQNRVIELFKSKLGYTYIGNLHDQNNSNIDEKILKSFLAEQGYSAELIRRAINKLNDASKNVDLYTANKDIYSLLRYGASVREDVTAHHEPVNIIDWANPDRNYFYLAEEVTVRGEHTKRPDLVLYINGIAVCVLELKRSTVSVSEGIRQNLDNQTNEFVRPFFSTIQLVMAGNDTEGLRIGVIDTPEKYFIDWKEDGKAEDDLSRKVKELSKDENYKVDRNLISICQKERLLDLIYNFLVFDGGVKKFCRHNQYFAVIASRQKVIDKQSGIIWHTQGSGKSLIMVWLSRWIKEHNPNARVLIVTDREELDDQIETKVFGEAGVGDEIYRTKSCEDLIKNLNNTTPRVICSLIHKFGRNQGDDDRAYDSFIEELKASLPADFEAKGDFYIFIDECHRTQSGKLHKAMKLILPDAMFIGFTGTPLLSKEAMQKKGLKSSIEIFGPYIHTYKFPEAVADNVILDLRYEARDIPQHVQSQDKIDQWFEAKTRGLNDHVKARLKKRWGTLKELYSSEGRLSKIVVDIIQDMEAKDRLNNDRGNAILVANSIYEACKYYKLFVDKGFNKCAIVTSYSADISERKGESTGEARETENLFKYNVYKQMIGDKDPEKFEKDAIEKFVKEPGQMKLLIVVDRLLTGFDAPSATYLYIDKSMRDHGLFQAICRVNRLDGEDKEFGYIIDYMDLFKSLEQAVKDYTSEAFDNFEPGDVSGLLKDRATEAKKRLDEMLDSLKALCEPVVYPQGTLEYIRYFCWEEEGDLEQLENNEPKRLSLYSLSNSAVRAFAEVVDNNEYLNYSEAQLKKLKEEVTHYHNAGMEVKLASGDYIDLKKYEADMRYLIDNYISSAASEVLSTFNDMTLIELILKRGVDFEKDLPEGLRKNEKAAAEAIENNIRTVLVENKTTNPLYYEKMSELLMKLIEEREKERLSYKEYLQKIVELTQRVHNPEEYANYPERIKKSAPLRALYDNYTENEDKLLILHDKINSVKPDKWKGDKAKEKALLKGIYEVVEDYDEVDKIFEIVKEQREYW